MGSVLALSSSPGHQNWPFSTEPPPSRWDTHPPHWDSPPRWERRDGRLPNPGSFHSLHRSCKGMFEKAKELWQYKVPMQLYAHCRCFVEMRRCSQATSMWAQEESFGIENECTAYVLSWLKLWRSNWNSSRQYKWENVCPICGTLYVYLHSKYYWEFSLS